MTTETKIEVSSGKFAEQYLLERVLFKTNQHETKRLATRIPSIKERVLNLRIEYFKSHYIKRNEIRDVVLRSLVPSSWTGELYDVDIEWEWPDCIDWMLKYMTGTIRVDCTHYDFGTPFQRTQPNAVICPSNNGITFLNIIHKKLAK